MNYGCCHGSHSCRPSYETITAIAMTETGTVIEGHRCDHSRQSCHYTCGYCYHGCGNARGSVVVIKLVMDIVMVAQIALVDGRGRCSISTADGGDGTAPSIEGTEEPGLSSFAGAKHLLMEPAFVRKIRNVVATFHQMKRPSLTLERKRECATSPEEYFKQCV